MFFFLWIPILALAGTALTPYTYVYGGKTITAQIGETAGVRVNDICLNAKDKCLALKVLRKKSRVKEIHGAKSGDYTGAYCRLLEGTPLFLHRESDEQFCVFDDLSMIDAKALYRAHQKRGKK